MRYRFRVARRNFWAKVEDLPERSRRALYRCWAIFRVDPFDPRLGTHKIRVLSERANRSIYSVVIEGDLRALFYLEGDTVWTFDIGTHDVYR